MTSFTLLVYSFFLLPYHEVAEFIIGVDYVNEGGFMLI